MPAKSRTERKRLNLLDWILLALILLGILLAVWYFWQHRRAAREGVELVVVMRIPAVERSFLSQSGGEPFAAGSVVRSENGTSALGVVQSVSLREHMTALVRDGALLWEADPYLCDIEVTVHMNALRQGSHGLRVHDLRIAAGGSGTFRFGGWFAAGTEIISVEVLGNEGTE